MSDEYESSDSSNVYYSPFWPMTIVLAGFLIWLSYQIFVLNQQRNALNAQLEQMQTTKEQAQIAQQRLVSLLKDLAQTSAKDPYAKQIMNEVIQSGLLRVAPNPNAQASAAAPASSNGTDTSTAPASSSSSDSTSTSN